MDKKIPSSISLRIATQQDTVAILKIAKALPEWFTPEGIKFIETDLQFQHGLWLNWILKLLDSSHFS